MNPRKGQFALGDSLHGWARLDQRSSAAQVRTLRRVYRGLEPRVYGRYGMRQWAAPVPWNRRIIKDPFALLSIPFVMSHTEATCVVIYRHPGAQLVSYAAMGWSPDIEEIAALGLPNPTGEGPGLLPTQADAVEAMAWFWSTCYGTVLRDTSELPDVVFVDHGELTDRGPSGLRELRTACGLPDAATRNRRPPRDPRPRARATSKGDRRPLHDFERSPRQLLDEWRSRIPADDLVRMEQATGKVWDELRSRSLSFTSD